ncbi:helix-turn-helix domain-containing protein [Cohnella lubricantis]|uniref:Helix-turn-helix transcriptional regulator n=1 Tax=Cohnella lubricantis TaxID=2163172 RepID=A0A841TFH6_9BACL|nr:helix-turn-helix domain-containing protein [Cohnella lubricantis]MBB6678038.1 helix-turn-helix transcriptional regulator [Cohnella lubricantis]MBP2120014.1 DNA-binding transcriptional ArsR family regulator [Cohnella lubricantis]
MKHEAPRAPFNGKPPLVIDDHQQRLLQSALRITIMHALGDEPKTAKQVADQLHKTPGNIHYHIQKLYDGGLLEMVDTRMNGGIVEKYYRARGTRFHYPGPKEDSHREADTVMDWLSRLSLSPDDVQAFTQDVIRLLEKWEQRTGDGDEYAVNIRVGRIGGA